MAAAAAVAEVTTTTTAVVTTTAAGETIGTIGTAEEVEEIAETTTEMIAATIEGTTGVTGGTTTSPGIIGGTPTTIAEGAIGGTTIEVAAVTDCKLARVPPRRRRACAISSTGAGVAATLGLCQWMISYATAVRLLRKHYLPVSLASGILHSLNSTWACRWLWIPFGE